MAAAASGGGGGGGGYGGGGGGYGGLLIGRGRRDRSRPRPAVLAVSSPSPAPGCSTAIRGFSSCTSQRSDRSAAPSRPAILARIEPVLDEQVRPGLRSDGGDIEVVGIDEDRIVQVRLTGACQGCSSSSDHADDAGRVDLEGRRARNPLRRGRPVIRPLMPRDRRAALAVAPRGLRPHPVLRHKCGYCDFASLAGVDHLADRYLAALEREMAMTPAAARRRWTRSSSAAGRRRGWMPHSSSG